MEKYFLQDDIIIGHKLIVNDAKPFGKKLSLQDVYYNEFIGEVRRGLEEIPFYEVTGYMGSFIRYNMELNKINHISFRNGGQGAGKTDLEKRINLLQYRFADSYLKKALKILEGQIKH